MGVAMSQSSVSYLWREPEAAKGFKTGVSLHSHTNQSKETLDFIAELSKDWGILQPIMRWCEARCHDLGNSAGLRPQLLDSAADAQPGVRPGAGQIEEKLQMPGLVSITDHDDINAPLLLRSLPSARQIPVSLEWTVPFGKTRFTWASTTCPARPGSSGWSGWRRLRRSRWRSARRRC